MKSVSTVANIAREKAILVQLIQGRETRHQAQDSLAEL